MPGPVIANPTPAWLKPENASVTDSSLTKALRMIGALIGADNPTAQVFGLMMTEVPGGPPTGGLAKAVGKLKERAIKVYHGSPHDFERFSMEKIGTGEGAQAYGHGLYFAENPAVAAEYRADLQQRPITVAAGKPLSKIQQYMVDYLHSRNIPLDDKAILSVGDAMTSAPFDVGPRNQQTWEKWKAAFEDVRPRLSQIEKPGRTYEVAIKADPEDFLDWDKPLSQQSEKVKKKLSEAWLAHPDVHAKQTGEQIYQQAEIANHVMGQGHLDKVAAAQKLRDVGIPGIKYLDQGSRASAGGELIDVFQTPEGWHSKIRVNDRSVGFQNAPTTAFTTSMPFKTEAEARSWANEKISGGTRNYVVFDDQLIDILKKYGLLLPAAGGVGALDTSR